MSTHVCLERLEWWHCASLGGRSDLVVFFLCVSTSTRKAGALTDHGRPRREIERGQEQQLQLQDTRGSARGASTASCSLTMTSFSLLRCGWYLNAHDLRTGVSSRVLSNHRDCAHVSE
jgi:hypothetical protein